MVSAISTLGLQLLSINNLTAGQSKLALLNRQLATGKKSLDLTDYSSSEAQLLMNLSNSITSRQGFLNVADTLDARIKIYDSSLTALEDIASQANSVALNSSVYNSEQNESLSMQIQGFMQQATYYLDQKVGDRYIFAGSRYGTTPVVDITTLPVPPTEVAPYTVASPALPSYDTAYSANPTASSTTPNAVSFTALTAGMAGGNITVTLTGAPLGGPYTSYTAVIDDGAGTTETYDNIDATGTTQDFWNNLVDAVNNGQPLAAPPTNPSTLITAAALGDGSAIPTDGETFALAVNSDPAAWVRDQVSIDTTQKLTYGVTSTQEGFQQLIMGLRWAYAATQDQANYSTYMDTARPLITSGISGIRAIHTGVASSNTILDQTKTLHNDTINNLQGQIDNIQSVDINEIAVKINTFQAELEASYAATGKMTTLSILKYL
ncbi:MAG: flagellin [Alphaproteobacteria bacterium]|nr:flagellin [Alphaproteobacteria bacterium]